MSQPVSIKVRFHAPPEDLRRYFTTFYITEFDVPGGKSVQDYLLPEWANLRLFQGRVPETWIYADGRVTGGSFVATGPSTRCTSFAVGTCRFWGIGFLPLGWARFFGKNAGEHVDLVTDGHKHPAFAPLVPLVDHLFGPRPDEEGELRRIVDFFRSFPPRKVPDEQRILAMHAAMVDPEVVTVADLIERVGICQRTAERLGKRHFGFSPKVLLRRQRFVRSLAKVILDPSLTWIGALDSQYHDQAQFVREFRHFVGMTPSEFAAMPHPVLEEFMQKRLRVHGSAVQALDRPDGMKAID